MGLLDLISVKVISASDNSSASFDYGLGNTIFENPLVDAANGDTHGDDDHTNLGILRNKGKVAPTILSNNEDDMDNGLSAQHQKYSSRYLSATALSGSAFLNGAVINTIFIPTLQ